VTRLRKMMLEELQRRNYSENTTRYYIRAVEDFSRRFNRSPDRLGPRHIREYQAELFQKRKLSPGTVATRLAALRFFYVKTLRKAWSIADTPYPKRALHFPSILSQEEVTRLIDAALTPYHRILLMTLYATGVPSHETAVHNTKTLRASPRSVPLHLAAEQISFSRFSTLSVSDNCALLPAPGRAVLSSALRRTPPAHLDTAPSLH
jgi:site-specific recombinase XerD